MMYLTSLLSISMTMLLSYSPLSLLIMVLLGAVTLASIATHTLSTWLAILLLLLYVGGLMVMFTYFICSEPNHRLKMPHIYIPSILLWLTIMKLAPISNMEALSLKLTPISNIMNLSNLPIILTLVIMLLLVLIAVVNITNLESGPMRPFNQ